MASWDFLPALEQSIEDYNSLAYPALADSPNPSKGHPALPFSLQLKGQKGNSDLVYVKGQSGYLGLWRQSCHPDDKGFCGRRDHLCDRAGHIKCGTTGLRAG